METMTLRDNLYGIGLEKYTCKKKVEAVRLHDFLKRRKWVAIRQSRETSDTCESSLSRGEF